MDNIRLFTTIVLCTKLAYSSHNEPTQPPGPRSNTTHVAVLAYKRGVIRSDGFPFCCGQGQTGSFSYLLKCSKPVHNCNVILEFSDLDLPCGSWLELRHAESDQVPFYMSDHGVLCDQTHARPLLLSQSHTLHITIHIPTLPPSQVNFDHVGYKATYEGIIKGGITRWTLPRTSGCERISGYQRRVVPLVGFVDCVWLINVPNNFIRSVDGVWIGNVSDYAVVMVHGGLSSEGDVLYDSTRNASKYISLSQFDGSVGLYIRARSLINAKHEQFTVAYQAYGSNDHEKYPANSSLWEHVERLLKDSQLDKYETESARQEVLNPAPKDLIPPGGVDPYGLNTEDISSTPMSFLAYYMVIAVVSLFILVVGAYRTSRRCKKGNRGRSSSSTLIAGSYEDPAPGLQDDASRVQSVGSVGPCGTSRTDESDTDTHPPDYDDAVADTPPSYSEVTMNDDTLVFHI